jgi:hypothetical protein
VKIGELNVILLWNPSFLVDLGEIRHIDPKIILNFLENRTGIRTLPAAVRKVSFVRVP